MNKRATSSVIESRTPSSHDGGRAVTISTVTAGYGERAAISDVTLELAQGSLTAIFGPNGGGKSTLLKCIAGLMRPWSGAIEVLGAPVGVHASRVAYVPQAEQVDWSFPIAVDEVVAMGRTPRIGALGRARAADRAAVAEALERVDMAGLRRVRSANSLEGSADASLLPAHSLRILRSICSTNLSPE